MYSFPILTIGKSRGWYCYRLDHQWINPKKCTLIKFWHSGRAEADFVVGWTIRESQRQTTVSAFGLVGNPTMISILPTNEKSDSLNRNHPIRRDLSPRLPRACTKVSLFRKKIPKYRIFFQKGLTLVQALGSRGDRFSYWLIPIEAIWFLIGWQYYCSW